MIRTQTMLAMVAAGLGVTIIPKTVSSLSLPGTAIRPLFGTIRYQHAVVWNTNNPSPLVAPFIRMLLK